MDARYIGVFGCRFEKAYNKFICFVLQEKKQRMQTQLLLIIESL